MRKKRSGFSGSSSSVTLISRLRVAMAASVSLATLVSVAARRNSSAVISGPTVRWGAAPLLTVVITVFLACTCTSPLPLL